METTGKLTGASRTFDGRGIILTFEVDSSAAGQIENLQNQNKLKIKAVRYTQNEVLMQMLTFMCWLGKLLTYSRFQRQKPKMF